MPAYTKHKANVDSGVHWKADTAMHFCFVVSVNGVKEESRATY